MGRGGERWTNPQQVQRSILISVRSIADHIQGGSFHFKEKELYLVQNMYWSTIVNCLLKWNRYSKRNANEDLFYSNATKRNAERIQEERVHARLQF